MLSNRIIRLWVTVLLVIAVLGAAGTMSAFATVTDDVNYTIKFNGEQLKFDQAPVNVDGCIMVPMRAIFEAYGASITWNEAKQQVTAVCGDKTIVLTIDNVTAIVNGNKTIMSVPAIILGGRTLVPVRFVSEALDANVSWDGATSTVNIKAVTQTATETAAAPAQTTATTTTVAATTTTTTTTVSSMSSNGSDIKRTVGFFSTQEGIKGACYLTSLGMVSSNLNGTSMNATKVYELNGNKVQQTDYWGLLTKLNMTRTDYITLTDKSNSEKVSTVVALLAKNPEGVICKFDSGTQTHFLVVRGYEGGKLIVNDPVGQQYVPLDKSWTGYGMFPDYSSAISGMIRVEAYNKL